jgi:sialate O-acetylesterase
LGTEQLAAEWQRQNDAYKSLSIKWRERLAADATRGGDLGWAERYFDDVTWESTALSDLSGLPQKMTSGARLRLRKQVNIPIYWGGRDVNLDLGLFSPVEVVYFNGVKVSPLSLDNANARYRVPAAIVQPFGNVIAISLGADRHPDSFSANKAMELSLATGPDADPIPLIGPWKYQRVEHPESQPDRPEPPPDYYPPLDSSLYNGMVAPLAPFAIRGIIWYQGESNVERGHEYRDLFTALISDWRDQWGEGEFPFYYAQLANSANSVVDAAAELREAQAMAMKLPNTGMAVTLDIGESGGHPRNKLDVGERLARWALAKDYGRTIEPSGPIYKSMDAQRQGIRLHFDHVGAGLITRGNSLSGFTVAGTDRIFKPAVAEIDGDDVVVHSNEINEPVAARYAWGNVVPQLTLFNRDGLPASPFRTDDWPGATFGKTTPWWWKQ